MDIVSSAAAVVGLVFNFATAAKTCKAVRGRYKDATLTIDSIRQELETLQAALQQLANLMMHDASALTSQWDTDHSLSRTFARSVRGFERTITGLQTELERLNLEERELGRLNKAKVVWNEDGMREHLARLRSQAGALQLLLHVIQVGAISEVKQHVKNLESALLQASVASVDNGDELEKSEEDSSEENKHQDQGDLLDLTWSEKNSEAGTTKKLLKSYPELIPTAYDADQAASDTDSISSNDQPHHDSDIVDLTKKIDYAPPVLRSHQERGDRRTISTGFKSSQRASEVTSSQGTASFIDTVIRGDVDAVTALLQSGHSIETVEAENGRTGLMLAALLNHDKVLAFLLDSGADASARDKRGRTALHFAAGEGSYQCAQLLLSCGGRGLVEAYDDFDEVPLHRAIRHCKTEMVQLLLPYYSNPMSLRDEQKRNIVHMAVKFGSDDMVEKICDHIRIVLHDKNCPTKEQRKDRGGQNCLCPATYPGLSDVDILGHTAFHTALCLGNLHTKVAILLNSQKDLVEDPMTELKMELTPKFLLEGKPIPWRRPLHHALSHTRTGQMYRLLVKMGANVNSKDYRGRTPLMLAKQYKDAKATKAVPFLRAHGAK